MDRVWGGIFFLEVDYIFVSQEFVVSNRKDQELMRDLRGGVGVG